MPSPSEELEQYYKHQGFTAIAGLDEAGKGAWAGPVVSAAVILPNEVDLKGLNDSKLLSAKQRDRLYDQIIGQAVAWGVGIINSSIIDQDGLTRAHRQSMVEAVQSMAMKPDFLLVDGQGINQLGVEMVCIVKGDQKVRCIAAASIIAKVTRDRMMIEYAKQYPQYGFDEHKGYGTAKHHKSLLEFGVLPDFHRASYKPIKVLLQ